MVARRRWRQRLRLAWQKVFARCVVVVDCVKELVCRTKLPPIFSIQCAKWQERREKGSETSPKISIPFLASASSKTHPSLHSPVFSRVKRRSSPARGYKFGCVCHEDAGVMTGHIGNKHTQICTPSLGMTAV